MLTLHIANGASASGTLKHYFKQSKLDGTNELLCFDDYLAIGPLYDGNKVNDHQLLNQRANYLFDMLQIAHLEEFADATIEDQWLVDVTEDISKLYHFDFTPYHKVVIWHGDNAPELSLLYLCCHIIDEHKLYHISINDYNLSTHRLHGVGACSLEMLDLLYNQEKKINSVDCVQYAQLWQTLVKSSKQPDGLLRIFESNEVKSVGEDYFDQQILTQCQEQGQGNFVLMMTLVGRVVGLSEQLITDTFIIVRVYYLIQNTSLEYQGDLDQPRQLQVRVRD
ncbi:DUF3658 domain-containing protein [uncultured Psychrobacter sp.]|uniref:DUF3658 domain-containing protein n=1 Tax=uncultured Psychrobacter sp. TaxID=259303 RepID=UPI00259A92A5|nr:DUF3658 domain-containing protein [uncultured Psychrobacter sp.]